MNEQQASDNESLKENVRKQKISLVYFLIFYPVVAIIIAGWAILTGKAQAVDRLLAALIALVFSALALIIEAYTYLTLPDKQGYNVPPGNLRFRYVIRIIEVASIYYVGVPAFSTLVDGLLGFKKFLPYPYNWLGLILFIPAYILEVWTIRTFKKGKGTTVPFEPAQKLIVTGPYKYIRNPMVLGTDIIILSIGLILSSYTLLFLVFVGLIITHIYTARVEEKEMELRFGQEYRDYKARVPRWIPCRMKKIDQKVA